MTYTQSRTASDFKGMSITFHTDAQGYDYMHWGPIRVYFGTGTMTGLLTSAPAGSLALNRATGQWYFGDDSAGTFTAISTAAS